MPVFQVEMVWRCSTCKTIVKGRFKECTGCGKAKAGEPFFDDPGEGTVGLEDAVTDPDLIRKAEGGSDWQCRYCGSHQFRVNDACANCIAKQGDSRDQPTKWNDGKVGPAGDGLTDLEELQRADREVVRDIERGLEGKVALSDTEPSVYESILAGEVRERRTKRAGKGYRDVRPPARTPAPTAIDLEPELPRLPIDRRKPLMFGAVALGCILLGTLFYFLFRTRIVDASVTSASWAQMVHVERYQVVPDSGFNESKPGDAFDVRYEGERHHHYIQVQDGTKTEYYQEACGQDCTTTPKSCYTTPVTCTNNNNGFKTCSGGDQRCTGGDRVCHTKYCQRERQVPKYKDVSVEESWYTWKVWRWKHHRNVVAEGNDNNPYWPSEERIGLNRDCTGGEKERTRTSASYHVVFTDVEGDKHPYSPKSENEFRGLVPGTKRQVKVRIIGENELVP